jgi:hypothetical protein
MKTALDAFWRAALYCLHPRVIALSILPLVIMAVAALALGYFFWEPALDGVRLWLDQTGLLATFLEWLEGRGLHRLRTVLAPMIVLFLAIPMIVVTALLFVAWMMTPAIVSLVGERRFAALERKQGGSVLGGALWSVGSVLVALAVMVITVPLWLIPPVVMLLPPLIWGWLTYRVMAYDVLQAHASAEERKQILKEHRSSLLGMGVVCGYLGAAPSVLWASAALFFVMAPILVPVAIWIYTLVFAFSALWFAHYCLAALDQIRKQKVAEATVSRPHTAPENGAPWDSPNTIEVQAKEIPSAAQSAPHSPLG